MRTRNSHPCSYEQIEGWRRSRRLVDGCSNHYES